MEIISLKCDYCFKEWLANETIRRYFISDVLDIPVEDIRSVKLGNTFLWKRYRMQKQGILDVLVELNNRTKINIEMQTTFMNCWDRRNLFYLAKMYTEDLRVGEKYGKLKRCIGISILDFDFTGGEDYHTVYRLRDAEGNEFSDVFEIHIIELGKKLKGTEKVDDWIRIINAEKMEDLRMIQAKNIGIKTAIEEIKRMSLSKRLRYRYEAYWKAKRDAWAIADYQEEQKQKFEREMEERRQEFNLELEERRQQMEGLNQQMEERRQEFNLELEKRRQQMEGLNQQMEERRQQMEGLNQQMEERRQEMEGLNQQMEERRQKFNLEMEKKKSELKAIEEKLEESKKFRS